MEDKIVDVNEKRPIARARSFFRRRRHFSESARHAIVPVGTGSTGLGCLPTMSYCYHMTYLAPAKYSSASQQLTNDETHFFKCTTHLFLQVVLEGQVYLGNLACLQLQVLLLLQEVQGDLVGLLVQAGYGLSSNHLEFDSAFG